jgi:hypothetical protein
MEKYIDSVTNHRPIYEEALAFTRRFDRSNEEGMPCSKPTKRRELDGLTASEKREDGRQEVSLK